MPRTNKIDASILVYVVCQPTIISKEQSEKCVDPGNKFGLGLGGVGGSKAYFLLFYHVNFKFEFSRGLGFRPSPPQDPQEKYAVHVITRSMVLLILKNKCILWPCIIQSYHKANWHYSATFCLKILTSLY